jgi:hypothetical protein
MNAILRVKTIEWGNEKYIKGDGTPVFPDIDGIVEYTIALPDREIYFIQPFKRGASLTGRIWDWDGNKNEPTLRPSIVAEQPNFRAHFYLTRGKIELLSDSTVSVG